MKRLISVIIATCFLISTIIPYKATAKDDEMESTNRPLVGVMDLELKGDLSQTLSVDLSIKAREVLVTTSNFVVLDRANQLALLDDMGIQPGGACDEKCALEIGRKLRAEYMVFGSVTEIGRLRCIINLSMLDIGREAVVRESKSMGGCMPEDLIESVEIATYRVTHIEMEPARLVVNATPTNTAIYLDGDMKGHVPVYLNLTPGFHKVRAEADGYVPQERTLNFKLGERISLDFKLKEEEKKFYKTWWFWGVVGVVAVGGTVAALSGGGGGGETTTTDTSGTATFYVPTN